MFGENCDVGPPHRTHYPGLIRVPSSAASPRAHSLALCMACRILDLSACRGISASSLQSALPQLKQLEVLHLDGNPEVCTPHCTHA